VPAARSTKEGAWILRQTGAVWVVLHIVNQTVQLRFIPYTRPSLSAPSVMIECAALRRPHKCPGYFVIHSRVCPLLRSET
jgi:thiosulfate reductase cytochrome b subunit